MQAIGKPLVAPLSVALPELPPVPQGQVARVLAEIGYPAALPALQAVASSPETEPEARRRAERAFVTIASATSVEPSTSAARLYTGLGNAAYALGSRGEMPPGFQAADGTGPVWQWSDQVGLVPVEVPGPLFPDALARAAATEALRLEPGNSPALTLFLASDLRSANTAQRELGGAADPSRDEDLKPADYYLSLAGPERARDVLDRALADGDPGLALSAVKGAAATASTEGLAPLSRACGRPPPGSASPPPPRSPRPARGTPSKPTPPWCPRSPAPSAATASATPWSSPRTTASATRSRTPRPPPASSR